jgi:tRNA A37 N6-isopentenylltransferase MiaA
MKENKFSLRWKLFFTKVEQISTEGEHIFIEGGQTFHKRFFIDVFTKRKQISTEVEEIFTEMEQYGVERILTQVKQIFTEVEKIFGQKKN